MAKIDAEVDAQTLSSPLPVLRAKGALRKMQPGQVLRLLATDSRTAMDVRRFCNESGHEFMSEEDDDGVRQFLIRRRPD